MDCGDRRMNLADARRFVYGRSAGRCECAGFNPDCTGVGQVAHHRRRRSQGGGHDPENLLWLSDPCHAYVHDHPTSAFPAGLMLHAAPVQMTPWAS